MSLNKVYTMTIGILLIAGIFAIAVIVRPLWMKFRDPFNSTVYNANTDAGIEIWERVDNTIENNFWLIPAVGAIIILGYIYISMSEKEYVTAGGYYR